MTILKLNEVNLIIEKQVLLINHKTKTIIIDLKRIRSIAVKYSKLRKKGFLTIKLADETIYIQFNNKNKIKAFIIFNNFKKYTQ